MEFRDYLRILKRRGWIIILLTIMTAAAAFAFSRLQTPIYMSSVDILIQPARPDFGLSQSAKLLLRSYVSWMNTDARAQEVIDLLELDRVPGVLRSDVKISSDESRFVIQITVEDPDGDLANDIARAWRDLFIQWRNEENSQLRKEDQVKAVQLDDPTYGLARPKWKINVAAGAVMGALVGGVIVFVLEWIESGVVRRAEDVDRYLGVAILGAIPPVRLETGRSHLLGRRVPLALTGPGGVRPQSIAAPVQLPPPQAAPSLPAEVPAATETAEQQAKPPEATPPLPPVDDEQIGPIEPTMLLSKGDEL